MIKCRSRGALIVSKVFGVPLVFFGLMGFFYFKMTLAFYIYLIVGLILLGLKLMVVSTNTCFCQKLTWFGLIVHKKIFPFKDYKCIELDINSSNYVSGSTSSRVRKLFYVYLVPKISYNSKPYLLGHCIKGEVAFNKQNIPKINERVNHMSEISGLPVCYSEQYKAEVETLRERGN